MSLPARAHSRYADGTTVLDGQQPLRITGPNPSASGCAHSVLRWDTINCRVYQAKEFDANGLPVRDIDFTNPTYPNGSMRPGHPGPPHQHRWVPVDPNRPAAGFQRGIAQPFP
jgi:hypothetical protein